MHCLQAIELHHVENNTETIDIMSDVTIMQHTLGVLSQSTARAVSLMEMPRTGLRVEFELRCPAVTLALSSSLLQLQSKGSGMLQQAPQT